MPNTLSESKPYRWVWLAAGFALSLGAVLGSKAPGRIGPIAEQAMALAMVAAGLSMLFSLAAFGPKTERARANRVRWAAVNVGWTLLGASRLTPDYWTRLGLVSLAALIVLAIALRFPRAWFALGL